MGEPHFSRIVTTSSFLCGTVQGAQQQIYQLKATGMGKLKIAKTVCCGVSVVQQLVA
jgi:hypothetical protein